MHSTCSPIDNDSTLGKEKSLLPGDSGGNGFLYLLRSCHVEPGIRISQPTALCPFASPFPFLFLGSLTRLGWEIQHAWRQRYRFVTVAPPPKSGSSSSRCRVPRWP